ncbi:TetR-like C-terminal domain-containing protein [Agrobacterium sp. NPDC089420]|uniref:TetR-like C-terminal domain-containing protein n=1 Tax=Agrobacterium sp. NPDC089420 TaxID=3363918 RepID=UPI00384A6EF0
MTLALAEEGFADLAMALRAAGPDPLSLGLAYLGFARANPGLYRLMFGEGSRSDSPEDVTLRTLDRADRLA